MLSSFKQLASAVCGLRLCGITKNNSSKKLQTEPNKNKQHSEAVDKPKGPLANFSKALNKALALETHELGCGCCCEQRDAENGCVNIA